MVPELVVYSECLLLSIINLSIINYALMKRLKNMKTDLTWVRGYGKGFYKKTTFLFLPKSEI